MPRQLQAFFLSARFIGIWRLDESLEAPIFPVIRASVIASTFERLITGQGEGPPVTAALSVINTRWEDRGSRCDSLRLQE